MVPRLQECSLESVTLATHRYIQPTNVFQLVPDKYSTRVFLGIGCEAYRKERIET
jgi:hypothetical protein